MKKKREANITPTVLMWFRENGPASCAIEIKATATTSIPKSALMEHQRLALMDVCGRGLIHKLTDEARRQQPFDAFKLSNVRGFVVACFTKPGIRTCKVIDVQHWEGANVKTRAAYEFPL